MRIVPGKWLGSVAMLRRDEIAAAVREMVSSIFECDLDELADDADFSGDLGGDSLKKLELVVSLEKRYNIKLDAHDVMDMNSVHDAIKLMDAQVSRRGSALND